MSLLNKKTVYEKTIGKLYAELFYKMARMSYL
jgi:hypothetical protein